MQRRPSRGRCNDVKLNYELQRELLIRLREDYPESVDLRALDLINREDFHQNAFYLDEHGLIKRVVEVESTILSARITEKGVDFLEVNAGLGAILSKVTVRLDAETLRALLTIGIEKSALPAPEKAKFKSMLGSFAGKAAERAI